MCHSLFTLKVSACVTGVQHQCVGINAQECLRLLGKNKKRSPAVLDQGVVDLTVQSKYRSVRVLKDLWQWLKLGHMTGVGMTSVSLS